MERVMHGTNVYNPGLPVLLAKLDAEVFGTEAMDQDEWQLFFDQKPCFTVNWITVEDKIIGAAVMTFSLKAGIAYLYSNAVLEEYRGKGFGKELINARINFLGMACAKIQAHTRVNNLASIKLLLNTGFESLQYVTDFYGDCEDAILWELRLK